jgi:ATP-dependent Zn protease
MANIEAAEISINETDLSQLIKLVTAGHATGSHGLLRRMARSYKATQPDVSRMIIDTLRDGPLRSAANGTVLDHPVDNDSRLPLIREEDPVVLVNEPILPASTRSVLEQIIAEHNNGEKLLEAGLAPTRTALFTGAPGVGKTLAARWIARELGMPLLVLDLSSVMSSFLGRTGVNVRRVLDYARSVRSVLLLDELDAVAKRRDDSTEIGELKRLVTVLLQEIDAWPEGSLLLAATNHAELLDPAVWRRFEAVVDFPLPDAAGIGTGIQRFLDEPQLDQSLVALIAQLYAGETLSTVERDVIRARRVAAMTEGSPVNALLDGARDRFVQMPARERGRAAAGLLRTTGLSQRAVHEVTGVSRDTLRKYTNQTETEDH